MKVSWRKNKKLKPLVILQRLKDIATVDSEGRVSFTGLRKFELDSVLFSMIDFHKEFSNHTSRTLYSAALSSWIAAEGATAEQFMEAMNKHVIEHNRKPVRDYVAITSVSLVGGFPQRCLKFREGTVESFPKGLPKKYQSRAKFDSLWKAQGTPMPADYCPVAVRVRSKSPMDAMELALDELDFIRGLHALRINSSYSTTLGHDEGSRLPINALMLGGMHTLHGLDGKIADDSYWYEHGYVDVRVREIEADKREAIKTAVRTLRRNIEVHPDGHVLKEAIIRYVRAFDGQDKNVVLQKTWAALESVMAPGENNTDLIVRRCSFMFAERDYHHQVLEHLKDYRNRSVHTGRALENPNDYCYQVQLYFRQAIFFHAANAKVFNSLQEANGFLDLPDAVTSLKRKKFLLDKAITFLSPKKTVTR